MIPLSFVIELMIMDLDLARFAVDYAVKKGAGYAEARMQSIEENGFLLKNGTPEISSFDARTGLGIRVLFKNSLGFMASNDLTKERIKSLIEKTLRTINNASKIRQNTRLTEEGKNTAGHEVKQKTKVQDIPPEEKMELLFDIEKEIMSGKIDVPGRYLSLSDSFATKFIVTSEGTEIRSTIPRVGFHYFLTIQDGSKTAQRYWQYGNAGGFEFVKSWNLPELIREEVMQTHKNMKHGIKPPKEKIDLVAAPQVVGIMVHESAGHPYEADRVLGREAAQAGESFIQPGMLGQRIGSEAVNVCDDPTIENSFGFYLYDDEGVKAGKRNLIVKGVMTGLLHNRESASMMKVKSNASSRAVDYTKEPIIRMANTFMLPGDHSEEELIEGVKNGIYMKNFMEWNIDDRRVHQKYVGAEAYLIKNGRITDPVRMPVVEIETKKLYSSVDAVAKNTEYHAGTCGKGEPMQGIPVWFGGPSIRLRNLRLGD